MVLGSWGQVAAGPQEWTGSRVYHFSSRQAPGLPRSCFFCMLCSPAPQRGKWGHSRLELICSRSRQPRLLNSMERDLLDRVSLGLAPAQAMVDDSNLQAPCWSVTRRSWESRWNPGASSQQRSTGMSSGLPGWLQKTFCILPQTIVAIG